MDDLISRQAALDAVINLWADKPFGNPALVEIKDCIEALPSAQQWIPCSERLPDAGEYYFVTVQHFGWNYTEYRDIDIAKYEVDGWRSCHNVLAWMPLPEPWKGERDG